MLQRHPGVVDPPDFYPPDNDVLASLPLVKFKVMRWETTGETSFHIRFCHALGEFGISDLFALPRSHERPGDGSFVTGCVTAISGP
jgi:hypothetical protein